MAMEVETDEHKVELEELRAFGSAEDKEAALSSKLENIIEEMVKTGVPMHEWSDLRPLGK